MHSSSPPRFSYKCPADIKWSSKSLIATVFSKHLQPTKCACVRSAEGQGEKQQLLPTFLLELVYIPVLFKASIYICILDPSGLPEETGPNPALVQRGGIALTAAQPQSFPPGRGVTCFLFSVTRTWICCFACHENRRRHLAGVPRPWSMLEDPLRLVSHGH